ncbi:MAG: aminoglycoside phosphotransferase family protein [Clostridia bacterium]|nr:aminoglycoside phosphotransferase family protein [Clostridia bacterium]
MENYLDLINDYLRKKNDLICFNSFSNDVRLFKNHIIKTFNSRERLEKCIIGLQIMSNTSINVPKVLFVCPERNIIVENYINGVALNEYTIHLTRKSLYDIGQLMGNFHNVNVSSYDNEDSWVITILSDMLQIRQSLAPYQDDFLDSIDFVERESRQLFKDLHFTYVHGDFRPANMLFSQSEDKYYLIDFENFMIGDPSLDVYKMLCILKSNCYYNIEDVNSFLDGYSSIRALPKKMVNKWIFYDVYYSLRSVRRAINDKHFRNSDDAYIINADKSAQRKNPQTLIMTNWLEKYMNNLH